MAREYAPVKVAIWSDDDFRKLTVGAQHLYFLLMTSPTLSHAGVADWRPNRIAALASNWSIDEVINAAEELEESLYILVDWETEEVLIRSFIRHDGLMKQPKMAVSMANAHAGIASATLRAIIVHELKRLKEECPELHGWASEKASELLDKGSIDPSSYPFGSGSVKGSIYPNATPKAEGSVKGSPSPAPTPAPTTSNQEPSPAPTPTAPPGPSTTPASQVVARWTAACKANGFSPISGQSTVVGRQARELLDEGNELDLIFEAADLAAAKGKPFIADFIGPAVAARRSKHTFHDDKGNPEYSPPPPYDPFAELLAARGASE